MSAPAADAAPEEPEAPRAALAPSPSPANVSDPFDALSTWRYAKHMLEQEKQRASDNCDALVDHPIQEMDARLAVLDAAVRRRRARDEAERIARAEAERSAEAARQEMLNLIEQPMQSLILHELALDIELLLIFARFAIYSLSDLSKLDRARFLESTGLTGFQHEATQEPMEQVLLQVVIAARRTLALAAISQINLTPDGGAVSDRRKADGSDDLIRDRGRVMLRKALGAATQQWCHYLAVADPALGDRLAADADLAPTWKETASWALWMLRRRLVHRPVTDAPHARSARTVIGTCLKHAKDYIFYVLYPGMASLTRGERRLYWTRVEQSFAMLFTNKSRFHWKEAAAYDARAAALRSGKSRDEQDAAASQAVHVIAEVLHQKPSRAVSPTGSSTTTLAIEDRRVGVRDLLSERQKERQKRRELEQQRIMQAKAKAADMQLHSRAKRPAASPRLTGLAAKMGVRARHPVDVIEVEEGDDPERAREHAEAERRGGFVRVIAAPIPVTAEPETPESDDGSASSDESDSDETDSSGTSPATSSFFRWPAILGGHTSPKRTDNSEEDAGSTLDMPRPSAQREAPVREESDSDDDGGGSVMVQVVARVSQPQQRSRVSPHRLVSPSTQRSSASTHRSWRRQQSSRCSRDSSTAAGSAPVSPQPSLLSQASTPPASEETVASISDDAVAPSAEDVSELELPGPESDLIPVLEDVPESREPPQLVTARTIAAQVTRTKLRNGYLVSREEMWQLEEEEIREESAAAVDVAYDKMQDGHLLTKEEMDWLLEEIGEPERAAEAEGTPAEDVKKEGGGEPLAAGPNTPTDAAASSRTPSATRQARAPAAAAVKSHKVDRTRAVAKPAEQTAEATKQETHRKRVPPARAKPVSAAAASPAGATTLTQSAKAAPVPPASKAKQASSSSAANGDDIAARLRAAARTKVTTAPLQWRRHAVAVKRGPGSR